MHWREVDDVEAEPRELRQHLGDAAKAAPRAREELVPRAEPAQHAVDVDGERRGCDLAVPIGRLEREAFLRGERVALEQRRTLRQLCGQVLLPGVELAPD